MKQHLYVTVALSATLGLGPLTANSADESLSATASRSETATFPAGFDWPANPERLQTDISQKNTPALRAHSWWLWAGINSLDDAGQPIWWEWPTATQTYPYQPHPGEIKKPGNAHADQTQHGLRGKNALNTPIDLDGPIYPPPTIVDGQCRSTALPTPALPDGPRFQSNGDIMIAGVIYNGSAFDWIQQRQLYNSDVLTKRWNGGAGDKDIAPFPADSIVLKNMYWPVKGDDFTALPVWRDNFPPGYGQYAGYETWDSVVIVDPRAKGPRSGQSGVTRYLYHVLDSQGKPIEPKLASGPIFPVDAFYHQKVDAGFLTAMDPRDRAILDASACWLYNRPFKAGDYLVAVAMHIITKEIPQWTLQSLWWSDQPNVGPFAADRPDIPKAQAPGPWRHYLLTVEYGIESAPGMLPVSFNPYIELAASHPVSTNCRNCHIRAAWPRSGAVQPAPQAVSSYEAAGGPGPLVDIQFDDPVFDELMRLDFQWAVSDRAGKPPRP
ncbi:MAG: hypothetical protein SVU69_07045 [Pseudomonadota bacterium]|nr:hypothetical protein [Pseudomonadota bacterium]